MKPGILRSKTNLLPMAVVAKMVLLSWALVSIMTASTKLIAEACGGHVQHGDQYHHHDEKGQQERHLLEYIRRDDYLWSTEIEFENIGARCRTQDPDQEDADKMDMVLKAWRQQPTDRRLELIQVPLYIHVMESEDGDGAVSDVQVQDQVDVMNAAFGPEIEFVLQEKIVTVNNSWHRCELSKSEKEMKNELRRGGSETLNIYLCEPIGGLLGWATLPTKYDGNPMYDGVVVHTESIPGGRLAPYNLGYTAVHETGHWVGLRHTFQGGCDGDGDGIADTPAESAPSYRCPVGRDSCEDAEGEDPVNNFMNYSDDSCMTEFTPGQTEAIIASYIEFRAVPGSIGEASDNNDEPSESTASGTLDDGALDGESNSQSEGDSPGSSTSEITPTDNSSSTQISSNGSPFSTIFGSSASQNTPSDNSGSAFSGSAFSGSAFSGSAFSLQQTNTGAGGFPSSIPQTSNPGAGSFPSSIFGSFNSGNSGTGNDEVVNQGFGSFSILAPLSAATAATTDTAAATQECTLKGVGDFCFGGYQCCSGECIGTSFFNKICA